MKFAFTATQAAHVVRRYKNGESSGSLARSLGVTDVTILNYLKRAHVQRRDRWLARRVYPLWDDAFSTLTPASAYWIGFLMADGCVCDESKLQLSLQKRRSPLRPIQRVPQNRSCGIKIHSRQIVSDLAKYGVIPRKSLVAVARGVDHHEAFWLGLLDGDGCVRSSNRGIVRMYGTRALMEQFVCFLVNSNVRGYTSKARLSITRQRPCKNLFYVTLQGRRAANFLRLVYGASPVSLNRKRAIAERLMAKRLP